MYNHEPELSIVVILTPATAASPINHRLGTADLLELHRRVISILEPIEAPITASLPLRR